MFQMWNQQKSLHETSTRPSTSDRMPSGSGTSESRAAPKSTSWRHKTRHGKEGSSFQFFLFADATVSYASYIFRWGRAPPENDSGWSPTRLVIYKRDHLSLWIRAHISWTVGQATVRLLQRGQASAMVVLRSTWDFPHSATSHTARGGQRMCLEPARASSKSEATANEGLYAWTSTLVCLYAMKVYMSLGIFHQNVARLTTSSSPQQTGRHAQVNGPSIPLSASASHSTPFSSISCSSRISVVVDGPAVVAGVEQLPADVANSAAPSSSKGHDSINQSSFHWGRWEIQTAVSSSMQGFWETLINSDSTTHLQGLLKVSCSQMQPRYQGLQHLHIARCQSMFTRFLKHLQPASDQKTVFACH